MFDMLQTPPMLKLRLIQAVLNGADTNRSKFVTVSARELMASCMVASIGYQMDEDLRLHYNVALNTTIYSPKPDATDDLIESIVSVSLKDMKACRGSICMGEYILPVKQALDGKISNSGGIMFMDRESDMVRTATTEYNMVQLSQAVLTGRPVIVQGAGGAGKSFLIRELAVAMNKAEELVELHVNDQTDAKALLGAYVCSDIPGEFIWQYGVLTQAVLCGRWVVIENINSVPIEFLASIAPLLSRRRLHLPNRNMEVDAHPSFRLFGTRVVSSTSPRLMSSEVVRMGDTAIDYNSWIYIPTMHHFSYDWHYVNVLDMSSAEVKDVLKQKFPQLLPEVVIRLMAVHQLLNDDDDQSGSRSRSKYARTFGLREMIKVAARIRANCGQFNFTSGAVLSTD